MTNVLLTIIIALFYYYDLLYSKMKRETFKMSLMERPKN